MKLTRTKFRLSPDTVKAKTILQGEEIYPEATELERKKNKFNLLRTVADQPELTFCQGEDFQKLTMYLDGNTWVVEAEAVVADRMD